VIAVVKFMLEMPEISEQTVSTLDSEYYGYFIALLHFIVIE